MDTDDFDVCDDFINFDWLHIVVNINFRRQKNKQQIEIILHT